MFYSGNGTNNYGNYLRPVVTINANRINVCTGRNSETNMHEIKPIKIGDYVDYTYDTVTEGYNLKSTESGYTSNQDIRQTAGLKWRILNMNEDGTVDLISDKPTNENAYFQGALGYNNGVFLLNDISKILQ